MIPSKKKTIWGEAGSPFKLSGAKWCRIPFLTIWGKVKQDPLLNYLGRSEAGSPFKLSGAKWSMIPFLTIWGEVKQDPLFNYLGWSRIPFLTIWGEVMITFCFHGRFSNRPGVESNSSAKQCVNHRVVCKLQIHNTVDHSGHNLENCKHFLWLTLHSEALPSSYRKKWPQHKRYLFKGCTDLLETQPLSICVGVFVFFQHHSPQHCSDIIFNMMTKVTLRSDQQLLGHRNLKQHRHSVVHANEGNNTHNLEMSFAFEHSSVLCLPEPPWMRRVVDVGLSICCFLCHQAPSSWLEAYFTPALCTLFTEQWFTHRTVTSGQTETKTFEDNVSKLHSDASKIIKACLLLEKRNTCTEFCNLCGLSFWWHTQHSEPRNLPENDNWILTTHPNGTTS